MSEDHLNTETEVVSAPELPLPGENGWRHAQASLQAVDVADQLSQLKQPEAIASCLDLLPLARRTEIFDYLPDPVQEELAEVLSLDSLMELLEELPADSAADLYSLLSPEQQASLLKALPSRNRAALEHLSRYEEGTAGALMTTEMSLLPTGINVQRALEILRRTAPGSETIYQTYVVDPRHRLVGVVSLRQLILASPRTTLDQLMTTELISVSADEHQEEVTRLISRYDLLALPVVDEHQRLLGIVTYDDAMDVAEEEATEDIHKSASIAPLEEGLLRSSMLDLFRSRITWLILLIFANLVSGLGISFFEDTIAAHVALVFFLPLLIGSGGNAGSQASTLMVRGLAVGDVSLSDWARLLGRELLVAGALGLTMALAVSPIGIFRGGMDLAMVVGISMIFIVLMGSMIGMSLPFILQRLNWDPATASAPLVTTLADVIGVVTYFALATWLLGLY
ncbi:magnesium transporter [Marinospirillum alkaliphilum]|uniref:Magnesium transporter MgtE n=1 Tax=Marinospirillum alkaliphilum DSM 21637 TaxID=1122209 RepID=A0A1K1WSA5_9GAMM|nr:magnesium transporter [Marinospirillum alkaliphilum]SFX40214.1 magnesium transporter [Marinospirillum alkaliphilum DSM 21637]